ncbi:D-3-phosphoglycerate dehydrogenase [Rubritalea squalenifaciens DSM 18772]|uniref:D-3-phosphoglycerate dehydrogenase n=1 Tax=Rubritalea squalenifaciens DSM 18772 TaxID=1123071 RepID=A0A1M6NYY7_9BACT|nr:phosphoglycerate dehydrogenase [Rubritalea squalenifaciens]SHK00871.1 D-3-phosphoglycerate dehydrogenase [Rubritalea squalenifaciens DSM 18772]
MATKRILVSDPISEKGVEAMASNPDLQVDVNTGLSPEELISIIGDYDGLVIRSQTKVTREVLEAATNLKVIGRAGVGVDNVDREAATDHGVIVMNTPTGNTISTAELAFTLMLSAARNIGPAHQGVLSGDFPAARKAFKGIEINEKTLAVLGMGRIGSEFAKRAQAFGMNVVAYDPFLTQARADQLKVKLAATPDEALTGADFVTLHVPLTDDTKHIINAERLALMNQGAIVVNCARGGLIDEPALRAAIDSGHIAGCGLDVYEDEPPAADHILFDLPKHVAFTPHLGASTNEAQENVGIQVAEQLRDFLTTGEIRNAINMPSLDAAALAEVGGYLSLGKSLGKFLAKLGPVNPDALRVSYHGPVAEKDYALITRTVLNGYLEAARPDGQVNIVNAPAVAKEMGLELIESTINAQTEFSELIVAELKKDGKRFRVAGTIIGQSPRLVEIDHLYVDTNIQGKFLIVRNDDRPGIVGLVGTKLAENDLNIANLSLARNKSEGNALSIIELDSTPAADLIEALNAAPGVISAVAVEI